MNARTLFLFTVIFALAGLARTASGQSADQLDAQVKKLFQQGRFAEALPVARKVVSLREAHANEQPVHYVASLRNLVLLYDAMAAYEKAEPLCLQVRELIAKFLGVDHPAYAASLNDLAGVYRGMGAYQKAEPLYLQVKEIDAKTVGIDHPSYATTLSNLGVLYEEMGAYQKAEPLFRQALEIRVKALGTDNPDYARILHNLAEVYKAMLAYEKAEPLYLQAKEVKARTLGKDHPSYATTVRGLANLYQIMGAHEKAEHLFLQVIDIQAKAFGKKHLSYGASLCDLAEFYREMGAYEKGELLFQQALKIQAEALGEDSLSYATTLNGLGVLYLQLGLYEKAEPLVRKAKETTGRVLGADHPSYALRLNNLAQLYQQKGESEYWRAELLLLNAKAVIAKAFGEDNPRYSMVLHNLAGVYDAMGQYQKAEPLYLQAIEIKAKTEGKDHPSYAKSLNNLGGMYYAMGTYEKAEALYLEAKDVTAKALGEDHPDCTAELDNLTLLYLAMKTPVKAVPLSQKRSQMNRVLLERVLSGFPENDRAAYVQELSLHTLQCSLENGPLVADSLLTFKGVIGASFLEEQRLLRANDRPEPREKVQRLQSLRQQFHRSILQGQKERTKQLYGEIQQVEKELARFVTGLGQARKLLRVQTEEVQAAIPASTALLEMIRYSRPLWDKNKKESWENCYGAVVVRHVGDPVFVRLPLAEGIDKAVRRFRDQAEGRGTEEDCRLASRELYQLLLAPLESAIGDAKTLVFSPDSQLHFVCFEPLLDANGKMACEKWNIRVIDNGRDLLETPAGFKAGAKNALLVGNPDYDESGTREAKGSQLLAENRFRLERSLGSGLREDLREFTFAPLPGTDAEIGALQAELKAKGFTCLDLRESKAGEAAVSAQIKGQRVVHLATHGFFLNELNIGDERNLLRFDGDFGSSEAPRSGTQVQDPMLRSGLALAGANRTLAAWQKGEVPDPRNDGILTAAEAVNLDLTGTELVVLSACETAKGKALDGEGIYGLRRALKMTGADTVVMTLWPVDDEYTVTFMKDFYARYLAGKHPAIALAETKRDHLIKLKGEAGFQEALRLVGPFIATGKGVAAVE